MANTVTQKTLNGSGTDLYITRVIQIASDGTEEADLVIFDNSTFCNDVSKGRVVYLELWGSACECIFEWDQTTDSEIVRTNPNEGNAKFDFVKIGGGRNPNGAGATGDILLTTTGLDANDTLTIKMIVKQH